MLMPTFILSNNANPHHEEIHKENKKTKNKCIFKVSHQIQTSLEPDIHVLSTFAFPWNSTIQEKDESLSCNFELTIQLLHWLLSGKGSTCQCRRLRFNPGSGKIPWRREWLPTPVFSPRESHRQRSLAGYSPQDLKESEMTEATEHACMHTYI